MSSTRSVISPPPFAENALTVIPPTPVAGVSYRDPVAGPASSPDGWPYAERVNSAEWNQIMFQISSLVAIQDKKGILGWSSSVDYTEAAVCFGSDGKIYSWLAASGPNNGGAKDPISNPTFWYPFATTGASRVTGLVGANNTVAPNTQFDFRAASVTLRNADGLTATLINTATITNNILTAGPAANGRDQAGAFTNGSWVHFYFIYNGTTPAIISSASATAPTLPAGYTHFAYATAVFLTAGGLLQRGIVRGSWFQYEAAMGGITGGTATVLTSVSIANTIPPNALQFELVSPNFALTTSGAGAYQITCLVVVTGAVTSFQFGMQGVAGASSVFSMGGSSKRLPNVSQNFAYQLVIVTGTGPTVSLNVTGYSVPNGGE